MICQPSRFLCVLLLLGTGRVYAMDLQYAAKVRERIAANDAAYSAAVARIAEEADRQLGKGPWTVTDKKVLAPTNDARDYVSLAPYFWPDPSKPDGLPYINKDGQVNPGTRSGDNSDRPRLEEMFTAVRTLNIAAYMTGKPQYARHSAEILRTFFINEKTRMNPNLNFAQGVRGQSTGRSYGIIDFNSVPDVLDSIKLFEEAAPAMCGPTPIAPGSVRGARSFSTGLTPASSAGMNPMPKTTTARGSMPPPAVLPTSSVRPIV